MKSVKYIVLGTALAASTLSFTGCKSDYLDTIPTESIGEATVFNSLNDVYIALNGIHRQMVSQESGRQALGGEPGFMMCRDAQADDMTWSTNTWMTSYLRWTTNMNPNHTDNAAFWRIYYQWILNANKILNNLDNVPMTDQALYNQIKGEALCFRAWAHFNLVQLYAGRYAAGSGNTQAGIPYRLIANADPLERGTVEGVYTQIDTDLAEACSLLEGLSIDLLTHYSDMVAWGLRARVALAKQDYANAATYAAKSIELAENGHGRKLMSGNELYCGFSKITDETKEAMYAARTLDDQTVYFYSYYAYMSWNFNATAIRQGVKCINADLYDTMSDSDLRLEWWDPTGEMSVPASSYVKAKYQNRKFRAQTTANAVGDVAFMRLAEMYLTQAEALARAGNTAQAQEVFTTFQVTRDPEYKGSSSNLITDIMNSRRVELWAEGFRFYDLKRLNEPIKRGSNFNVVFCTFLEKGVDEQGWIWEIPLAETDYNPLCPPNY